MDPIAEMFSQIRNAKNSRHESLQIPYSKMKMAILEILKNHHQIADYRIVEKKKDDEKPKWKKIEIKLRENMVDIKRVSRPGRRVYTTSVNIPRPKRPKSLYIISTPLGILEGEEARKKGVGGELVAEVR